MPESTSRPTPYKRDRGLAQVRTLARRANIPVATALSRLRNAGILAHGGGPLYATSRVDLDAATRAFNLQAENIELEAEKPRLNELAEAAQKATGVEPLPLTYTGDDDQPQPQFIVESADPAIYMDFPPIINPDPDKIYYPIHISPDRQHRMVSRGFQFVKDRRHIARIGQGTLERYINARGRVQFKDRELAFMTVELAKRRQEERHAMFAGMREAVDQTFAANVEATKRSIGRGADTKLEAFEMSEGEAIERAEHAEARKHGVQRVVLDLGGKAKG